jgi:hypothetical protein
VPRFPPEGLTDPDDVLVGISVDCDFWRAFVAPYPQPVEEVKPTAIPHLLPLVWRVRPEVDRAGEDPFETVDQPAVMRAVAWEVELLQNLGRGPKQNRLTFLSNRQRRDPDRDQAVLPERQPVIRVRDHVELESAVAAGVLQRSRRRPPDRETAQNKGPGVERQCLLIPVPILADQLDGFDSLLLPPGHEQIQIVLVCDSTHFGLHVLHTRQAG